MYLLDHIGIVVKDLDQSITDYKNNFGFELTLREKLSADGVEIAFLKLQNTSIELLAPTSELGPLVKFLIDRGPGLHHICYKVEDIKKELKRLRESGHTLIDEEPRSGARNTLIAFIHPKSMEGVLTELCEYR